MPYSKLELQQQVAAIDAFVASPAHVRFQAYVKSELDLVNASILEAPPATVNDLFQLLQLFGDRQRLVAHQNLFEVARGNLEAELLEIEQAEVDAAETSRQTQNEERIEN